MPKAGVYIVVYDISGDRERRRVSKILEGLGSRVQESVFECMLSLGRKAALVEELEELEIASGHIILYRLATGSITRRVGVTAKNEERDGGEHAFIA